MKKIITLSACLLISLSAAFAGNGNTVYSLITKQIKVPAQLKNQKLNEKVNVQFRISENGNVSVVNVNTDNSELKNYVINQFNHIDFSTVKESKEQTYFIDINFKVL